MIAHRIMGNSLLSTGDTAQGREHLDKAIALYDPAAHRPLAMQFGSDVRVAIQCYRPLVLWLLGYPEAALADADEALEDAHEIGPARTLMVALFHAPFVLMHCGNYAAAEAIVKDLVSLAEGNDSSNWRAGGILVRGWVLALIGKASELNPHARLRDCRVAINGINGICAVVLVTFGECKCGTRSLR